MIRRPPRSTLSSSSAASDVYKRQARDFLWNPSSGVIYNPSDLYGVNFLDLTLLISHNLLRGYEVVSWILSIEAYRFFLAVVNIKLQRPFGPWIRLFYSFPRRFGHNLKLVDTLTTMP